MGICHCKEREGVSKDPNGAIDLKDLTLSKPQLTTFTVVDISSDDDYEDLRSNKVNMINMSSPRQFFIKGKHLLLIVSSFHRYYEG